MIGQGESTVDVGEADDKVVEAETTHDQVDPPHPSTLLQLNYAHRVIHHFY